MNIVHPYPKLRGFPGSKLLRVFCWTLLGTWISENSTFGGFPLGLGPFFTQPIRRREGCRRQNGFLQLVGFFNTQTPHWVFFGTWVTCRSSQEKLEMELSLTDIWQNFNFWGKLQIFNLIGKCLHCRVAAGDTQHSIFEGSLIKEWSLNWDKMTMWSFSVGF